MVPIGRAKAVEQIGSDFLSPMSYSLRLNRLCKWAYELTDMSECQRDI
jgi:hypothetical protein